MARQPLRASDERSFWKPLPQGLKRFWHYAGRPGSVAVRRTGSAGNKMLETLVKVGAPSFFPYVRTIAGGTGVETSQGVINGFHNGNHKFLPFVANGINSCTMNGQDVISAHFTGCVMAVYDHQGTRKVCHVSSGEFGDCSAAWAALKAASVNVFEFKPSDFIGDEQFELCYGLITSELKTYTILTSSHQARIPSGATGYRTDSKFVKIVRARLLR